MLAQYVSPAVLASVVDKYEDYLKAEIGSKEKVSILFADIRGFTSLSETLTAEKTVEMLNTYFSAMTEVIFSYHGTIDKFIGDAIMAFWGAPLPFKEHAKNAVMAAMKMHDKLSEVNQTLMEKGFDSVHIGIGINTGEVILGNIGSDRKLDYTVIGDNVNLASRLEGLTKQYGCGIIISEFTYAQIKDHIPCRIVDMVRVKGKQHPIKIYTPIICPASAADQPKVEAQLLSDKTQTAFNYYLSRRWQQALQHYQDLPEDNIRTIFMQRCRQYLQMEPPIQWNGVYTLTEK